MAVVGIVLFVLGTAIGSFLNVIIHRLPRDESPVFGRSKCPGCGAVIRAYDNIPILSYLILGGKCRQPDCRFRISPRYPLVELVSGVVLAGNFLRYGPGLEFIWASVLIYLLIPLALIDARHYLLPDELTIGGFALGVVFSLAGGPITFKGAVLGSVMGGGFLLAVSIVGRAIMKKEVMGEGDVKMMAMVGAFLGWKGALLTIFLGSLLGTLIFGPISLKRKMLVPFGVFLALGAAASLYLQGHLVDLYLGLFP